MITILLIIIYISFISLGLPDSLLGSAWPVIYQDIHVSVSFAGIISMVISFGTVVSSLMSTRVIKKLGTGLTTAISVAMTAVALFGYALSNSFLFFCLFAIPLGLGAGSVDAALNNFVALHYKAKHMSWLHCFWGVGASLGPVIMSLWLNKNGNWSMGYVTIAIIQSVLVVVLIASLPVWHKISKEKHNENDNAILVLSLKEILHIKNAKPILLSCFCYCAIEVTASLWGSSYAVTEYGVSSDTAATWLSAYYFGITFGRFLSGFVSVKLNNKQLIRLGQVLAVFGIVLLFLPVGIWKIPVGFSLIGLGCAPIYPSILHETPNTFGKDISQAMMGVQMACAYMGSTFMPPLFGLLSNITGIGFFPVFLVVILVLMVLCTELVNYKIKKLN